MSVLLHWGRPMTERATIYLPGEGKEVRLAGAPLRYLATSENSKYACVFEWTVAPGFSTGRHVHRVQEETFFVLEGECTWEIGDRTVAAEPGAYVLIPPGVPHNIANRTDQPARMIMTVSPPGHERYFDELSALVSTGSPPDPQAIAQLRSRFDTEQLSTLQTS